MGEGRCGVRPGDWQANHHVQLLRHEGRQHGIPQRSNRLRRVQLVPGAHPRASRVSQKHWTLAMTPKEEQFDLAPDEYYEVVYSVNGAGQLVYRHVTYTEWTVVPEE